MPAAPSTTITDIDSTQLSSANVTISSGCLSTDVLTASVAVSGITVVGYSAVGCTLSFSGAAPLASYQTVIQGVTFNNTGQNPGSSDRVITVTATDVATIGTNGNAANMCSLPLHMTATAGLCFSSPSLHGPPHHNFDCLQMPLSPPFRLGRLPPTRNVAEPNKSSRTRR